jgi:hypothetical protein
MLSGSARVITARKRMGVIGPMAKRASRGIYRRVNWTGGWKGIKRGIGTRSRHCRITSQSSGSRSMSFLRYVHPPGLTRTFVRTVIARVRAQIRPRPTRHPAGVVVSCSKGIRANLPLYNERTGTIEEDLMRGMADLRRRICPIHRKETKKRTRKVSHWTLTTDDQCLIGIPPPWAWPWVPMYLPQTLPRDDSHTGCRNTRICLRCTHKRDRHLDLPGHGTPTSQERIRAGTVVLRQDCSCLQTRLRLNIPHLG